jgi:uncharacterized membrane protein required for colicin V production
MDILAFAAAIGLTSKYGQIAATWIETTFKQHPPTSTFIGYIGVWIGIFGILSLLGMSLSAMLPAIGLGTVNRMGGVVGGTLKGMLICIPILMPIQFFKPDMLTTSIIAPAMAPAVTKLGALLFPAPPT